MKNLSLKKILIILTIAEAVVIAAIIAIGCYTFGYDVEMVLNEWTEPWLGEHTVESKYDVNLMQFLHVAEIVLSFIFMTVFVVRLALAKTKYRLICIGGLAVFVIGFLLYISVSLSVMRAALLLMGVGIAGIIWSHWLGKEYDKEK